MTPEAILAEVNQVFIRIFDDKSLVVKPSTTAKDIPAWDSLNHASLIAGIEDHFKIKFTLKEIMKFQNVGDMCAVIAGRVDR